MYAASAIDTIITAENALSPEEMRMRDPDSEHSSSIGNVSPPDDSDSDDDLPPELTSPLKSPLQLSFDAPAFVPRAKPHRVNIFSAADQSMAVYECDLSLVTIQEMQGFAAERFAHLGDVELVSAHTGEAFTEPSLKAIDEGIANNSVVLVQPKCPQQGLPLCNMAPQQAALPAALQQRQHCMQLQSEPLQLPLAQQMLPMPPQQPAVAQQPQLPQQPQRPQQQLPMQPQQQQQLPMQPQQQVQHGSPPPRSVTRVIKVITTRSPSARQQQPSPPAQQLLQMGGSPRAMQLAPVSTEVSTYAASNEGARALVQGIEGLPEGAPQVSQLLSQLRGDLPALCVHQHGSKVLRSMIRRASPEQAGEMLTALLPALPSAVSSTSGSDVLAELFAKGAAPDAQAAVVSALLRTGIYQVCCSVQGRKIVVSALSHFDAGATLPLYEALCGQLLDIATDQCGCITIQRCVDCAMATQNAQAHSMLQGAVLAGLESLVTDLYGNYVVQHLVKLDSSVANVVISHLSGRLLDFATNKFASNVVERCLENGSERAKKQVVTEVLQPHVLGVLMNDAYGNFVVQSCVDLAPAHLMEQLRAAITPLLSCSPYGYRIDSKLQRRARRNGGRRPGNDRRGAPGHQGHQGHQQQEQRRGLQYSPPPTSYVSSQYPAQRQSGSRSPPTIRRVVYTTAPGAGLLQQVTVPAP